MQPDCCPQIWLQKVGVLLNVCVHVPDFARKWWCSYTIDKSGLQKDAYIIIILHVFKRFNDFDQFWLVDTSQRHLKIFEFIVVIDSVKS